VLTSTFRPSIYFVLRSCFHTFGLRCRLALVEAEILAKYGVRSAEELEEYIRRGRVAEHPTWEDLIALERLLEEKKKLSEALRL